MSKVNDRLASPLPNSDGKRFRDVSLIEQHEILFRFLEEIYDEVLEIKSHLTRHGSDHGEGW